MKAKTIKKIIINSLIAGVLIVGILVLIAYSRTWGKTDLEFRIHINEELVLQSVYGESPTFAIWIEDPQTHATQTIFVTNRAGSGDWEGKSAEPAALPLWDQVNRKQQLQQENVANEKPAPMAVTGATPQPGYFTTRVRVKPDSKWICWIEMNLSGDYNESYKEYDSVKKITDEHGNGQPALVYKARIQATEGNTVVPKIVGMALFNTEDGEILKSINGITTALNVFDEMSIVVVKPKPRIIEK